MTDPKRCRRGRVLDQRADTLRLHAAAAVEEGGDKQEDQEK